MKVGLKLKVEDGNEESEKKLTLDKAASRLPNTKQCKPWGDLVGRGCQRAQASRAQTTSARTIRCTKRARIVFRR
jgi:hypothetical protein